MSQISADPTPLVQFIASFTADHYQKTGRRTDGAILAEAIRNNFSNFNYADFGIGRLSEAIRLAEEKGLVVRHHDVKHLEISPGPKSELPPGTEGAAHVFTPLLHVRSEVWRAFVHVEKLVASFLNKNTYRIITVPLSDNSGLTALKEDSNHIRIDPITSVKQQQWMKEFVAGRPHIDNESSQDFTQQLWWVKFPEWLRSLNSGLEREWNQFRTSKIIEQLKQWCSKNEIDFDKLAYLPRTHTTSAQHNKHSGDSRDLRELNALRNAIKDAVSEMTLDQLQEISIPARYLVRHFVPR
jgi:hypothetical protein